MRFKTSTPLYPAILDFEIRKVYKQSMRYFLTIAAGISMLIISSSLAYYYILFLPEKQQQELRLEEMKLEAKQKSDEKKLEIENAWKLYEEQNKAAKDQARQFCFNELKEKVQKGMITNDATIGYASAQEYLELYIKNCMIREGYSVD